VPVSNPLSGNPPGVPAGNEDRVEVDVLAAIGNTPLIALKDFFERRDIELWAKIESLNPGGSSKDRSAARMIEDGLAAGLIGSDSTVIESTSGNLGIGLAQVCLAHGLRLICVVDSRTDESKQRKMRDLGAEVRVVTEPDPETGDLLAARLALVEQLLDQTPRSWQPDQYANPSNPAAHRETMAEIDGALGGEVDWLFVATSTTGTLRGCCDYLVDHSRTTKVVAVDAVGSVLFGGDWGVRKLPGLGAGIATELSKQAWFDHLVRVSEIDCVVGCRRLAHQGIFVGASAGGVAMAADYLSPMMDSGERCAMIFADGGEGYLDTVYDDAWVERELGVAPSELHAMSGPERRTARTA